MAFRLNSSAEQSSLAARTAKRSAQSREVTLLSSRCGGSSYIESTYSFNYTSVEWNTFAVEPSKTIVQVHDRGRRAAHT